MEYRFLLDLDILDFLFSQPRIESIHTNRARLHNRSVLHAHVCQKSLFTNLTEMIFLDSRIEYQALREILSYPKGIRNLS